MPLTNEILVRDNAEAEPRRARFLLLAYACSPDHGSEPSVGWNRALEAARIADTWVICEETRYGPPIRRYLDQHGPITGLNFHFVPRPALFLPLVSLPGAKYGSYYLWQCRALRIASALHARIHFDLAHQVTFCGYREPSFLGHLNVPFVWGPIGGTQNYPWRFLPLAGWRGAIREGTRSLLNSVQLRFSPRVRRAAKSAAAVLAANTTIQEDFRLAHEISPDLQLETGVTAVIDSAKPPAAGPLRILWSGELECWKALPLLLRALAALPPDVRCEVRILGRGSLEKSWRRQADALGVAAFIRWLGFLPFREAFEQYAWADVLTFTSLRDTSGNVVLEALANGVPVICLDHQGVRDIVTSECGIKVAVRSPRAVVSDLAEAIRTLAEDQALRAKLSRGALERARNYLWSKQGERMAKVYRDVLAAAKESDQRTIR